MSARPPAALRDRELEDDVLGAVLDHFDVAWPLVRDELSDRAFAFPVTAWIWRGVAALAEDGARPDVPLLARWLDDHHADAGLVDLVKLQGGHPRPDAATMAAKVRPLRALQTAREASDLLRQLGANLRTAPHQAVDLVAAAVARLAAIDLRADGRREDAWIEPAPALLSRTAALAPAPDLVPGMVAGREQITLAHAEPRALKTWWALEVAIALTTSTPVCGAVPITTSGPVCYITGEDAARRVADRVQVLCAGRDCRPPADLHLSARRGVWLDEAAHQRRLLAFVEAVRPVLVVLDPLRSLTACVDQGPRELQPFARFARELADRTAVLLLHHDTKPQAGVADTRRRPHKASGGGLFSIADAPIALEPLGHGGTLFRPCAWKHAEDPPARELTLRIAAGVATWTVADVDDDVSADDRRVEAEIVSVLRATPELSGREIRQHVKGRDETTLAALRRLEAAGRIDSRSGARGADRWFLREVPA